MAIFKIDAHPETIHASRGLEGRHVNAGDKPPRARKLARISAGTAVPRASAPQEGRDPAAAAVRAITVAQTGILYMWRASRVR